MYAIIETGGKQFLIKKNIIIYIEKVNINVGENIFFEKVLLYKDSNLNIGYPFINNVKVIGIVEKQGKNKKKIIFKYKPKKHFHCKKGHRQFYTKVRILDIKVI